MTDDSTNPISMAPASTAPTSPTPASTTPSSTTPTPTQPGPPGPPRSGADPPGATRRIRGLRGIARLVQVLLVGWLGIAAVAFVFGLSQRSLIERIRDEPGSVRMAEIVSDSHRWDAINGTARAALVVTGIAFIVWLFRAYANVD